MLKINDKVVYGALKCPDDCKNKDIMCKDCVDADFFDSNAQ